MQWRYLGRIGEPHSDVEETASVCAPLVSRYVSHCDVPLAEPDTIEHTSRIADHYGHGDRVVSDGLGTALVRLQDRPWP